MKFLFNNLWLLLILMTACSPKQEKVEEVEMETVFPMGEIIDLSYEFSDETVYWVTSKEFELEEVSKGQTGKGYFYSAYNFSGAEHGGTHIDAPIHFAENGQSVDEIPLEKLMGKAIKIDVSEKASQEPDYQVSQFDLEFWEAEYGQIPEGAIILLQTGFGQKYPDKKAYLGTDQRGTEAIKDLHFPGLAPDAAKWLVEEREIHAIGIDTPSIDYGQSQDFGTHVALMTANIPAFENVANLEKLPAKNFNIIALPMKIKGGSGGPLRIVAIVK